MASNVVMFPVERIIWRKIEQDIQAEAAKNCHIGSGHIRFRPSLDRLADQLPHIPRDVISDEIQRLAPQVREAVAQTNAELRQKVYLDPIDNRRRQK